MIFKKDLNSDRVFPVSLAPDTNENDYFQKYEHEDNLLQIDDKFLTNIDLSLPVIFKNGNVRTDVDFIKKVEEDNYLELIPVLLQNTDKFMISDFPISEIQREEMIKYRNSLRTYSKNKVNFPELPEFAKKHL